jgi:hypothetical protein
VFGAAAPAAPAATPPPQAEAAPPDQLNVLIFGDSLALFGFGKRLDSRFRDDPRVNATFTYMTCGTNPLSWLKQKPYTDVKTQCGFAAIESTPNGEPRVLQDVYGMTARHVPKAYLVPKLEDLMEAVHPDVLIIQTGSNLFGLFPDTKTVIPSKHGPALERYLLGFKDKATEAPSRLKKIYWVNPPTSGRVAPEVQEFLWKQVRAKLPPEILPIDSRPLVSYPYKQMQPDKEHFLGAQQDEWADKVFDIISRDLNAQPLASLQPLSAARGGVTAQPPPETARRAERVDNEEIARAELANSPAIPRAEAVLQQQAAPVAPPTPITPDGPIVVQARLAFRSEPMPLEQLLPYQESLVAYVYDIEKVVKGRYGERRVLVMHPAHIALKEQKLKYRIGKRYKMRLDPLEGTLWDTAKARDESGQIDLQPYIRVEDAKKHPQSRKR